MGPKVRLLLYHHNRLFRDCLISALGADDRIEILACEDPDCEAWGGLQWEGLHLILIDASLPDMRAFRLVQLLRANGRSPRTILLVSASAPDLIDACLQAGTDGCVLDDDTLDDLRQAIEIVHSGRSYCSPQVADRLFKQIGGLAQPSRGSLRERGCNLTLREVEILRMIAHRNLSNKQIARELRISIYTVKNHVHSIIEKLGVEDRQTAVRHAVRRGMLSEPIG